MADKKISALTAATTPLAGTEVLPIVQSGATVKVANNDLRPKQIQSNATSGVLQVTGPAAAATRVMTVPDANFTAARTDAAQTFTGVQTISDSMLVNATSSVKSAKVTIRGGTSNNTTYQLMQLSGGATTGGNPQGAITRQETLAVANVATTILTIAAAGEFVIVTGVGAGAIFCDLLVAGYNAVAVVSSNTQQGGPAARTYTITNGALELTMGSATAMDVVAQAFVAGGIGL